MCRIMATIAGYDGSMKHGGINTQSKFMNNLTFIHEHLPIQSSINDVSIIETEFWIVLFNGEILDTTFSNDLDYLRELFKENTIRDVYKELGKRDGFYSFICYDKVQGFTYAFTDPLGKKQLYYDNYSIASELRPLSKRSIDNLFMSRTIKFGYVTDDSTPFTNIKRVIPNKIYIFDQRLRFSEILDDNLYEFNATRRGQDLPALIQQAVDNRLKGHENISLLLSGGLDSSIINYHILKSKPTLFDVNKKVDTYCVDNLDDLKYAKMMDRDVKEIQISSVNRNALKAMEMPLDLGSMIPQYELFKNIKDTVILTGDGADEIFGGYRRMTDYDSQLSDIFDELPYYHNIRLDRMSMIHTKEVRSPFMSIPVVEFGLSLDYSQRIDKKYLRESYEGLIVNEIIYRPKEPLKTNKIRSESGIGYRSGLVNKWKGLK